MIAYAKKFIFKTNYFKNDLQLQNKMFYLVCIFSPLQNILIMQRTITKSEVEAYVRANWFKLLMIGLVVFIFLRKDLSFSFNLNSPAFQEEGTVPLKEGVQQKKSGKKEKPPAKITDIAKGSSSKTNMFDLASMPYIGKGNARKVSESEFKTIDANTARAYIDRFAHVAINERKKYGVPASIILGNALLHGFAGKRDMAIQGNNHFSLPCVSGWSGDSGTYNDACYRHYENAWASFRDHSLYVTTGPNQKLLALGNHDFRAWAKGLEQSRTFETNKLATKLIDIIVKYDLDILDRQ